MVSDNLIRGKTVLVTGGAGFIGSHLVEAIVARGFQVVVLDNLQSGTWANLAAVMDEIRIMQGDVRNYDVLEDIIRQEKLDCVFHLAANASVPGSVKEPRYDFETNCDGTFVLLDSLRRLSPDTKVVVSSSAAVYGEPECVPIRETMPMRPISPYGASKVAAEVVCRMFSDVYGLSVVVGRVFNTYGPRMPRFVVLDFLRKLSKNSDYLEILGDGKQVRDFNYVTDTVSGLVTLGLSGKVGEAYNIASGKSSSVTELALDLLRVLGLEEQTRLSYSGASWSGDAQHWEADISKIRDLGYKAEVDLRKGLKRVVMWFEQRTI
jgi:UDP-glucose 4-epimerase